MPPKRYQNNPDATFVTTVAKLGIAKKLRRYLPLNMPFVAALSVPDPESFTIYHDAARLLLAEAAGPDTDAADNSMVDGFFDLDDAATLSALNKMYFRRHTILLFTTVEDLPPGIRLASDLIAQISPPTGPHFVAAARTHSLKGMTSSHALYLSTQPLHSIQLAVREGRPIRSAVDRLKEQEIVVPTEDEKPLPSTSLDSIVGYGEVREWGLQVAADVVDWRDGKIAWSDMDTGALISGPPGCGKTTFAAALANSADMTLVVASAARWQAKGHLGDYLKAMRASFAEARKNSPSILFLDEFDSFGDRDADHGDDDHRDYKRQAINGLLECIDGSDGREGVIVIGATNDPSKIDAALLRPGRLERHLSIQLPDAPARLAILRQHLGGAEIGGDLSAFIAVSRGWTGARIEQLARDAKRTARRGGLVLDAEVVTAALPRLRKLTVPQLHRVACHEVGHAIVGVILETGHLKGITIERFVSDDRERRVMGEAIFRDRDYMAKTATHYLNQIALLMGGIAGEKVMLGDYADGAGGQPTSDLAMATDLATVFERHMGLGETLTMDIGTGRRPLEELRSRDPALRRRVEEILRTEFERALGILGERRREMGMLADKLVANGVVSGDEVRRLVGNDHRDANRQP